MRTHLELKAARDWLADQNSYLDAEVQRRMAENELIKLRLSRQMPGVGDNEVTCEQAGRSLTVVIAVRPTPNPNFRRVDAQVLDQQDPILRLSTVVGRL